jgi:hypothetical protein
MITLLLALSSRPPPLLPQPTPAGRIYTSRVLHVGVRPAVMVDPYEIASGVTLQISWLHLL